MLLVEWVLCPVCNNKTRLKLREDTVLENFPLFCPKCKQETVTSANHTQKSLSTYPFPLFLEEWELDKAHVADAWDNKGDIVIGNDVWIGFEAIIMSGVTIGDGAIVGTRAVVTKDVPPYTIVGGVPAKPIRKRFSDEVISSLLKIKWWEWSDDKIKKNISALQTGDIHSLK